MDWDALKQRDPKLYAIAHQRSMEREFSGAYLHTTDSGVYLCALCKSPLFSSEAKFDFGSGWPSFVSPLRDGAVRLVSEHEYGTEVIEVECASCKAFIGRLFCRETQSGGKICDRYCINSVSLDFKEQTH